MALKKNTVCNSVCYKIDNDIPFAMAEIHRGNESFVFDLTKSSLMNPYEFISDRYMALYIDQHLNGRIFNYIHLFTQINEINI